MKISKKYLALLLLFFSSYLQAQKCGGGSNGGNYGCPVIFGIPLPKFPFPCNICIPVLHAFDPNDIAGPVGYEEPRWVAVQSNMGYTVRFENDPDFATAPAQKVVIELPLGEHLNPYSFRLGEFGFGDFRYQPPDNIAYYAETLTNTVDSLGVVVDVTAGVDVVGNKAFWIFESKDPLTGLPPDDALLGFLPVNDTTVTIYTDTVTQKGEGFVTFFIDPLATAVTGDSVNAQAAIVFDINAPIPTNVWTNILDAFPPTSAMNALPPVAPGSSIELSWTALDDPGGVGVGQYDLYVSQDGLPFYLFAADIDTTSYLFTGEEGSTYSFYTRATDFVGNEEAPKTMGEASVLLGGEGPFLAVVSPVAFSEYCLGAELTIEWLANLVDEIDILLSADGGASFETIATAIDPQSGTYTYQLPLGLIPGPSYLVQLVDAAGSGLAISSEPFVVHALPVVALGNDTTILAGASLPLEAGIPNGSYQWSTGDTGPAITVTETGTYSVTVTDPNGCSNSDEIEVTVITSIPEQEVLTAFKLFPNPTDGQLQVSFYLKQAAEIALEFTDLPGNPVYRQDASLSQGNQLLKFDLRGWPAGPYLLSMTFEGYEIQARVVKAR